MSDDFAPEPAENLQKKPRGKPLAKGYDPRRWMKGAPRKPKDKKKAEELLEHVIWDVLSEEIRNPNNGETIDRLRAMIRSMTTSRQSADKQALLDRIAGKVTQGVDLTTGGEKINEIGIRHIDYRNGISDPESGSGEDSETSGED